MKAVMSKNFSDSALAGEYYNLVRDILYGETGINVYFDGFTVRIVGEKEKIEELKQLLS